MNKGPEIDQIQRFRIQTTLDECRSRRALTTGYTIFDQPSIDTTQRQRSKYIVPISLGKSRADDNSKVRGYALLSIYLLQLTFTFAVDLEFCSADLVPTLVDLNSSL